MDVERLRDALRAVGWQANPRELAEVIWLAGHLPAATASDTQSRLPDQDTPLANRIPEEAPQPPVESAAEPARSPLYVAASPSDDGPDLQPARPVRAPYLPFLPPTRDLLRALRPLKRRRPAAAATEVDEEATATWFAERRRWLPVLRPALTRALDVALVLDATTPSAAAWSGLGEDLQGLLGRLGAFQNMRVRHLVSYRDGRLGLTTGTGAPAAAVRGPADLLYPRTRRVVLVVTDCVSTVWASPEAHKMLSYWARSCAVAILQPLPERLWSRTSLPPVPGSLRGSGLAAPNTALSFAPRDEIADGTGGRLPVPVLEISAEWLGPWAQLVTGTAEDGIDAVAALIGGDRTSPAIEPPTEPPTDLSPFDRVLRFRAEATPEAYRLAGLLAAAPLTPSTMRLVQAALLPRSRPAHLAEVWFSGLLVPMPTSGTEPLYEFVDGVRDVLLGTLRRHEMLQVLDEVSRFVNQRLNRGGATFLATTPDPGGELRLSPLSRPFARVRAQALYRLRGPARDPAPSTAPEPTLLPEPAGDPDELAAQVPAAVGRWGPSGAGPPRLGGSGSRVVLLDWSVPDTRVQARLGDVLREAARVPAADIATPGPGDAAMAVRDCAAAASDVLFVYYSGHAVADIRQGLILSRRPPGADATMGLPISALLRAAVADGRRSSVVVVLDLDAEVSLADVDVPADVSLLGTAGKGTRTTADELVTMLRDGDPGAGRNITLADFLLRLRSLGLVIGEPHIVAADMSLILGPNRAFQRTPIARSADGGRVTAAKIMIAGGFGSGMTTLVGSVSEVIPLTTEAILTSAGVAVDDTRQVPAKTTMTVAMDFGRISIDRDLIIYLFGVPGSTRFWFMWDELVRGAIGAVVVVDTRRLADCFAAIDFFEYRRLPYLIAINCFDGIQYHNADDVREALAVGPEVPVVSCDVRSRESSKQLLISLVEYVLTVRRASVRI